VEPPDRVAGASVERERPSWATGHPSQMPLREPAIGREVDEAVEDSRRAHDPTGRMEAPAEVAGARVDCREVPVPGPDVHHVPPDRGRRVDVGPRLTGPEQVPGRRPERVDGPVCVADEDASVGNGGGGVEVLTPAEPGERLRVPALTPGARAEGKDAAAVRPDVDGPVRVGRRADDLVVDLVAPDQAMPLPAHVERIDPAVPCSEVENASDEQRRRLDRAGPEAPFDAAGLRVERDDAPAGARRVLHAGPVVHQREVDRSARDRR
jgi:hypothetical protein